MFKRLGVALAGLVLAAVPLVSAGPAGAVTGTCDPASRGAAYNEMQQVNGPMEVYARYGWDGVSVRDSETGCDGPVLLLRGTNTSTNETWYAHFEGRKHQWVNVSFAPGESRQITSSGQLRQLGVPNRSDLDGMYVDNSPTPPSVT